MAILAAGNKVQGAMADSTGKGPSRIAADDLSIVIPFRYDRPERLENLGAVLRHLTATLAGAEIIVIEDGPQMHGAEVAARCGAQHIARINAGAFHRTALLNLGIEVLATRRFAASYDTDALIYPAAWARALDMLRAGAPVVFPYGGRFCDLCGALRAQVVADPDLALVPAAVAQAASQKAKGDLVCINPNSVGGVVLFDRVTYTTCGGYHEGFVAWGFEDAEIMARMTKLGHPYARVEGVPLIHLSHPRGRGWRGGAWYRASRQNNALYRRMGRLSAEEIKALIAQGGLRATAAAPRDGLFTRLVARLHHRKPSP